MADGRVFEVGPGDLFEIGPGHDSVVIGDEPYVSIHLLGADQYAAEVTDAAATHDARRGVRAVHRRRRHPAEPHRAGRDGLARTACGRCPAAASSSARIRATPRCAS